jgi:hypothetical protein
MAMDNPGCAANGKLDRTCVKDASVCGAGPFSTATEVENAGDRFEQCQTGVGGATLSFVLYGGDLANPLDQNANGGKILFLDRIFFAHL